MIITRKQIEEFAGLRLESALNPITKEQIKEYADNCAVLRYGNPNYYTLDDGAHGYLIVPKGDQNYAQASAQYACQSIYNYRLQDGTILLEEDCEAPAFLEAITN